MKDAGTSEKEDTDSQDSTIPMDHGNLAPESFNINHNACRESRGHLTNETT